MGTLKVAVHQPNYLPWLGYFHKIQAVDVFVLLDTVQFERRGYTHRVRIAEGEDRLLWLTQHVRKASMETYWIKDVTFSDSYWIQKHLKTLKTIYSPDPYFEETFSLIDRAYQSDALGLSAFNGNLIRIICNALNIQTEIIYASEIDVGAVASPSERIARITKQLRGTHYVSGAGARAYNDPIVFKHYGVELNYSDFVVVPYLQRRNRFCAGLSIVDALFNLGPEGVASLLRVSGSGAAALHHAEPVLERISY